MSDHSRRERTTRSYTRKEVIRGAVGTGAALGLAPMLAACGDSSSSGGSSAGGRPAARSPSAASPTRRWCPSATCS